MLRLPLSALLPLFALVAPASADVVQCGQNVPPHVICLTGTVTDLAGGGPLEAGKTYHISGIVSVPAGQSLTVEGGAIVKFGPGAEINAGGTLVTQPGAIFTSVKDDTQGGDTNGDGPSVGMPGDWDGIFLLPPSDTSTLDGAEIMFAVTGLGVQSDAVLTTLDIHDCERTALDLFSQGRPTVTDCSFTDNGFAVDRVPFEALPGFMGNSAGGNIKGDYIHVTSVDITQNLTVGPLNGIPGQAFVVCRQIVVPGGLSLTLLPGTVIKWGTGPYPPYIGCGKGGFSVQGTLDADGVALTSVHDDSIAGDTQKNGSLTMPMPADWGILQFGATSDASLVQNTLIRFGGFTTFNPFIGPAILLSLSDASFVNVTVKECAGDGMRLEGNSFPTVDGCSFTMNGGIAVNRVPVHGVPGFTNNTGSGNAGGDYVQLLSSQLLGNVTSDVTYLAENSINSDGLFVVANSVTVDVGATLTLGTGVTFKWVSPGNRRLKVDGTLITDGVTFTVLTDDSVLGDSNKDGGATEPSPGDWQGIAFGPVSGASVIDESTVRYAGHAQFTLSAVSLSAADITITDTRVEFSESAAVDLQNTSFPTIAGCDFDHNVRAIIKVPIGALPGFDDNGAMGNSEGDYLEVTQGDVGFGPGLPGLTIGPSMALLPAAVFVVSVDIDVPQGRTFSILGGTIIKWNGNYQLDADGAVQIGSLGNSVVFTSCEDDSIGGDTKKDGFTEGSPGDWRNLSLSAPGNFMEDVFVRFAGSMGTERAIELLNQTSTLKSVRVEDSATAAVDLNGICLPVMDSCEFKRNPLPIVGVPIRALPGFTNNSAEDNFFGDYVQITNGLVPFDILVRTVNSLDGRPFVYTVDIDVLVGSTLTIDGGVVFKADGNREVDVDGTLLCNGTGQPVIFTTLVDDIAGDTNKDMGATVPTPGSWQQLDFGPDSDASVVATGRIRYAGSNGPSMLLSSADIKIIDTTVEFSGGAAVNLTGTSFPQIRRSFFQNGASIPITQAPLAAVSGFSANTGSGNAQGEYVRVSNGFLNGTDAVVQRDNSINQNGVFGMAQTISVAAARFELRQGTILKWLVPGMVSVTTGGELVVEGTGREPVVMTSIHDDTFGGDSQKNGSATVPAPGDWGGVDVSTAAAGATIEHLLARYGGASVAGVRNSSDQTTMDSVRVEFAAGDGIRLSALSGDATNLVAYQNGADGIEATSGTFDLIFPTVTRNGFGVRRSTGHSGTLRNGIVVQNTNDDVVGFNPGEVFSSNAGAAFAGIDGNIDVDPMFTDAANGDLTLAAASACVGAADLATALGVPADHLDASRVLDYDLDGTAQPDMGAFELPAYRMTASGEPRVGFEMGFRVDAVNPDAPPAMAIYFFGPLGNEVFQPAFGFRLHGAQNASIRFALAPTGQDVFLSMPPPGYAVGDRFGVQARAIALAPQTVGSQPTRIGNWSNLYSGRALQ